MQEETLTSFTLFNLYRSGWPTHRRPKWRPS